MQWERKSESPVKAAAGLATREEREDGDEGEEERCDGRSGVRSGQKDLETNSVSCSIEDRLTG